jgi:O-antigen/teichoic acid export membrane protein
MRGEQTLNNSGLKVLRGIMTLGSGTVLRMLFSFLGLIIAARVIPKDDLGVYFLLFVIVAALQVIGGLGMGQSSAKFLASASGDHERQIIVNNVLTLRLVTMLAISLLAIIFKPVFMHLFPSELLPSLFIYVPLLFCVQSADVILDSIMQGFQLFRKMAFIRILSGALNLGFVLLFLMIVNLGIKGYILANILSQAFTSLLRYWMIPTRKALAFKPNLLRRIIRFGLPLHGNDILTFISQRLDILLVGGLLSPTAVSYLGIAKRLPDNLKRASNSIYSVYFPHMSSLFGKGQKTQAEEILNRFLRLTSFATALGTLIVTFFQRDIVVFVFSEKYAQSAPAFGLLMIIFILSVASTLLDSTLIAAGHPDYIPIISLADTVPSVLANIILIPIFGFMGAVYAKLIANIITNPVSVWALHREKIGVSVSMYIKPILFLMICLAIYFGLGWKTIILKGFLIIIFVLLCVSFSIVTRRDVADILNGLKQGPRQAIVEK